MKRFLIRLGSRAYIVGEIASAILLAKGCEGAEATTSSGGSGGEVTTSSTGAGGTGGDGGSGGSGAAGGSETTTGSGGSGGVGGSGGAGGATTGSGCVSDPYVCEPKDCGVVDNGCGFLTDCGGCGDPMVCGTETHVCECKTADVPQGGCASKYPVQCAAVGGCVDAVCALPNDPKFPEQCQVFDPDGGSCCAKSCDAAADCDDGNECTTNGCGGDHLCEFLPDMTQPPCADGSGVCISGECVPL